LAEKSDPENFIRTLLTGKNWRLSPEAEPFISSMATRLSERTVYNQSVRQLFLDEVLSSSAWAAGSFRIIGSHLALKSRRNPRFVGIIEIRFERFSRLCGDGMKK
jgi:hypothetical protein